MKYSYDSVVAMPSPVSLTSHVHKSSLQIRSPMVANCFPSHRSVKNNANGWKAFSLGVSRLCSCSMQMDEAWSWSNLSQPSTGKLNMLHYIGGWISRWWGPRTRDACQRLPRTHIFLPEISIQCTHTHKLDLQFILWGAHTQAAPHKQRNSMKRNGLASWGEWTATARGRRNDRKESLSFIWERCAHTSFVEQQGRVRGKVPMSPSLIGAYPSALSLSHYGRSRMLG